MSDYPSQSQPPKAAAYTAPENPTTRNQAEVAGARLHNDGSTSNPSTHRGPGQDYDPEGGVEWAQGRGARGHDPVDEREAKNTRYVDAGKFASGTDDIARATVADEPLGEGKVADAVERKSGTQRVGGGTGEIREQDFASDLDRKKAEQAEAREQVKEARKAGADVDGGSGFRRAQVGDESLVES